MDVGFNYGFDQDSIIRLQKDLNHILLHLNDQNVRNLNTDICDIRSGDGETVIDGPLIKMYGKLTGSSRMSSDVCRLEMGWSPSTSNFVFKLYNAAGGETVSLDASGNAYIGADAVVGGNVNTTKSMFVGDNIFIGNPTNTTSLKGVYFNSTAPVASDFFSWHAYENITGLLWCKNHNHMNLLSTGGMAIAMSGNLGGLRIDDTYGVSLYSQQNDPFLNVLVGRQSTDSVWQNYIRLNNSGSVDLYASSGGDVTLHSTAFINLNSTGAYIASDAASSSQLIATRGWVLAQLALITT
jgi:hypothetical protein